MAFRDDRRAAAIQVGAVLLLGFLVIALSLYQVTVVPEQNERVEFRHNQAVQNDLLDLRNALLRAGTSESVQPVSVEMGTIYPSRVLFVNPAPPSGLVRNGSARNVTLANVSATNRETNDFLNASANGPYNLSTKNVSYRPGYNVYQSAPTTSYQSGVTVNEFEDANDTAISGQTLVQGNRIYLVAVRGNLSRAQVGDLALDPRSLSTSTSSTTVRNTTGGNVTLTVPTTLSTDRWRTLLETELDPGGTDPNRYVTAVSDGPRPDTVDVTLEADETYRLRTAYVGVGTGGSTPGPRYMRNVTATDATLRPGDEVVVEVRDRFNNPVDPSTAGGVRVNVTAGTSLVASNDTSVGDDGRARFEYVGGAGTGSTLNLSIDATDVPTRNASTNVSFDVTDGSTVGDDGTGSQINPSDGLVLRDSIIQFDDSQVNITLRNTGIEMRNITALRFNFYDTDSQSSGGGQGQGGGNNRDPPESFGINGTDQSNGNIAVKSGAFVSPGAGNQFPGQTTRDFRVTLFANSDGTGDFEVRQGDFFVVSVEINGGNETATYFVAPTP